MTRKKFIKMLMGKGISRNNARLIAFYVPLSRISYNELMQTYELDKNMSLAQSWYFARKRAKHNPTLKLIEIKAKMYYWESVLSVIEFIINTYIQHFKGDTTND